MVPGGSLSPIFDDLKKLGFFASLSWEEARAQLERVWGLEVLDQSEAEWMLASLDEERIWHQDLKFVEGDPNLYADLLAELARLTQGALQPEAIERQGEGLRFRADDYLWTFTPAPGHYLDMSLVGILNSALCGTRQLEICDNLGMPNLVAWLSQEEKVALKARGWSFVDSLAHRTSPPTLQGFLHDHFDQGMDCSELSFQDKSFCQSSREGWRYEGKYRIQAGAHLTVLDEQGRPSWSGLLGSEKIPLFQRLLGKRPGLFPASLAEAQWRKWFVGERPGRAWYRPQG